MTDVQKPGPARGHVVQPHLKDARELALAQTTAAIGSLGPVTAAPTPTPVPNLIAKIDALIEKIDASIKTDETTATTYIKKYWPIVVGVLIAASRFLHL